MAQTGYTPILIYSSSTTSNVPAAGNLTNSTLGSELAINITDGKLFYKDNANAVQVIGWKTTPTTAGGTGLTSYTAGDLLYYASGTTLSKLAIGTSGQWLGSSGSAPQWNSPAALTKTDDTNVTLTLGGSASTALLNAASLTLGWTGQLAVTRGGTGLSTVAQGDILYGSAANTLSALAKNTTATRYLSNTGTSNNPAWAQINLANGVTGTLPIANGGTNATSFTGKSGNVAGLVYFDGTSLVNNATVGNVGYDTSTNTFVALNAALTNPVGNGSGSVFTTTIGNNSGTGGGGYAGKFILKTDNGGGNQSGYGVYISSPYDGSHASGNYYPLNTYGVYVDDMYGYYGNNTQYANYGLYIKGGYKNYIASSLSIATTNDPGAGNLLLGTGNVVQGTAGKGYNFSANSAAAGMTSQLLNYYEEGTWTPVIGGSTGTSGQTYDIQAGYYTRVGRLVTVHFRVALTAKGTITGNAQIQGLPFTINNSNGGQSSAAIGYFVLATNVVWVGGIGAIGGTAINLQKLAAAASNSSAMVVADIDPSSAFMGSFSYIV